MKFKVLEGMHNEGGHTYKKGEVVDSASNLLRLNSPGSAKFEKVEEEKEVPRPQSHEEARQTTREAAAPHPVPHQAPASAATQQQTPQPATRGQHKPTPNLEAMSTKELQELAAAEEIDLKGAKGKEEILKVLRGQKS